MFQIITNAVQSIANVAQNELGIFTANPAFIVIIVVGGISAAVAGLVTRER